MHVRLRGRYRWALLAGGIGAIAGCVIGALLEPPTHRAVVRIQVTAASDADAAHLAALADQHARRARSASIATIAMTDEALLSALAAARDAIASPDDLLAMTSVLGDDRAVRLAADHADPAVASAAAASLARALLITHRAAELADADALAAARRQRNDQLERLATIEDQRRALLAAAGPVPLDQAYHAKLREVDQITDAIDQAQHALTRTAADESAAPAAPHPQPGAAADASGGGDLNRMALTDRKLASLLLTRRDIERRIAESADRFGQAAPVMVRLRDDLASVQQQIDRHLASADDPFAALGPLGATDSPAPAAPAAPTAAALRARLAALRRMDEQARAQLAVLADSRNQMERLTADAADTRARLDAAQRLADQRAAAAASRGSLADPVADAPVAVLHDRRPALAALGAAAGFASAAVFALLLLVADRRILRPADAVADSANAPLLGSVPTITPDQTDPRDADLTALSIHQIRALIEVRARARDEHAFAITSPSKGAGKTSLTVGLASSLALSGTRTLLVDCELASRLADRTDEQPNADQSLDEVMVQMGYLDPREQDLFVFQDNASVGLLGMMGGRSLEQCAVRSSIPGLSVLPALAADAHDVGKMSTTFLRRIIDEARGEYDMVLFDTGPIPGSIEAMLVAGVVDGVVIVAARGEDQHRYNRTLAYLDMVGAKLAGLVFNRADRRDLTLASAERRTKKGKPQPAPFGAATTRRLPPPPGMGSGILAAAVHAQAQSRRGDLQVPPQITKIPTTPAKSPARPKPTPQPKPVVGQAGPEAASGGAAEGPGRAARPAPASAPVSARADSPAQITVADAGDIASILDEAATVAEASSDRDMTEDALEKMLAGKTEAAQRAAHATPKGKDGKPLRVADELDADDRMTSAIDELLSDADAADPRSPRNRSRAPQIHVDPGEPTRKQR